MSNWSPRLKQISIIIQKCSFNKKREMIANDRMQSLWNSVYVTVQNLDLPFFS